MQFLQFITDIITLILLLCTASAYSRDIYNNEMKYDTPQDVVSKTITVDQSGQGNFVTVQQAIDSVPNNNRLWVRIHVKAGIYK